MKLFSRSFRRIALVGALISVLAASMGTAALALSDGTDAVSGSSATSESGDAAAAISGTSQLIAPLHSVAQINLGVNFSQATQDLLVANGGVATDDVLEWIIKFTPVPNGNDVQDGPGGYVTFYVPDGFEVVGASVVQPQGNTFVDIAVSPPGPIPADVGEEEHPWPAPFDTGDPYDGGAWESGVLPQLYGDTGIFYSTDARTAKYVETALGDGADPDLVQISLSNGYKTDPTGCDKLADIVGAPAGAPRCRAHNLWDADMANSWGTKDSDIPTATPTSGEPALNPNSGRGRTPYLVGSAVAGPDTFYGYDHTGVVGPWNRIAYAGSTTGTGLPTDDQAGASFETQYVSTSAGSALSEASPLPANTNAVRWAVGGLEVGEIKYVKVRMRVLASFDQSVCHPIDAEVFGGDSGTFKDGKDNPWRYFEPAPGSGNTCVALQKTGPAYATTNEVVTYDIVVTNITNETLHNVVLTDVHDEDFTYTSAQHHDGSSYVDSTSTTPSSWTTNPVAGTGSYSGGSSTYTWPTMESLAPGETRLFRLIGTAPDPEKDVFINTATVDTDETSPIDSVWSTNMGSVTDLSVVKTVTPETVAPGDTVTYTVTFTNDGDADAENLTFIDTLDPNFSYVLGTTAVDGTPASDPLVPEWTWDLGTLVANDSLVLTFDALVAVGTPQGACYPNNYEVAWDEDVFVGTRSLFGVDVAPVCIPVDPDIAINKTVYAGHDSGAGCAGSELVSGVSGAAVTYCFEVTNTGDTYLDVALADPDLGIDQGDMNVVSGDLSLAPGESVVLYYDSTITADLTNTATATGDPTDDQGVPLDVADVTDDDTAAVVLDYTPAIAINKTVYAGHDSGATCDTNTTDQVDGLLAQPVTYCFTVTNTGDTYLDVTLDDVTLTLDQDDMSVASGDLLLAPGESVVLYFEDTITADLTNTATATGDPTDDQGVPLGIPDVTDEDIADVTFVVVEGVCETNTGKPCCSPLDGEGHPVCLAITGRSFGGMVSWVISLICVGMALVLVSRRRIYEIWN
ncbi:MAG: DUF11 domain-containing protein [Acidimicrobiales bacterium]|nr:DUF11 domain-containing protein [Acidimicrobiales bacterium]MDG2218499.1 DUF11 domain-containing protein [Acidimicrobiales bacterium]